METSTLYAAGPKGTVGGDFVHLAAEEVPQRLEDFLRCPKCRARLSPVEGGLLCLGQGCRRRYPVVDGVPVLILDDHSLFRHEDFAGRRNTTLDLHRPRLAQLLDRLLPRLGRNLRAKENYRCLAGLLLEQARDPAVLVIGGSISGQGFDALAGRRAIRLIETDVSFGPRTQVICDAHDLPFADHSFDGVVIQAVLQYVPDPVQCVGEIARVLKPGGLVYAETAFMQQVVHGCYDFTRFTHLGLCRLFRGFEEVRSGPVAGPGMALAWACHFFLLSFASGRLVRRLIHGVSRLLFFWLKYFDALLIDRPGTYDAASGFFFLGRQHSRVLSDRELVALYRGAQSLRQSCHPSMTSRGGEA